VVEIITASPIDTAIIEDILRDSVRWLDAIGQSMWREDQITWVRLSRDFSISDFRIALLDGVPAACMAVVDHDPVFWPDVKKGRSLFIHKLAVKRFAAGKGLSDALIADAKAMCVDRGIAALRLDCAQDRPKLRTVYERNGFLCVEEKVVFTHYPTAFYLCQVNDTEHLYHYYEKDKTPLRSLTMLPLDQAMAVLRELQYKDLDATPKSMEWLMTRRYALEKQLCEKFTAIGGNPINAAPIYFSLGANEGLKTCFCKPRWIKIPVREFAPGTLSFTYGDSFVALNPALDAGHEWHGQVYHYRDILNIIERHGFPQDPSYDLTNGIFPKDKPIHQHLKYIEAHVWSDEVLDQYRP